MNPQSKLNMMLGLIVLNFCMLIYLIMLVVSNQQLINQNKGMISKNTSLMQK